MELSSRMKNLEGIPRRTADVHCMHCFTKGFLCYDETAQNGHMSCPCCGMYTNTQVLMSEPSTSRLEETDVRVRYPFCGKCGILFARGCLHDVSCSSKIYNAHVVRRWKWVDRNERRGSVSMQEDNEMEGMPVFNGEADWRWNASGVVVLEMGCLEEQCNGVFANHK